MYLADWEQSLENADELYVYYERFTDEDVALRCSLENRARQRALLKALSSFTSGHRLLDVGCGIGQRLRGVLQRSRALSTSRDLLNLAVSRAGLGDTLVAWLQKPRA